MSYMYLYHHFVFTGNKLLISSSEVKESCDYFAFDNFFLLIGEIDDWGSDFDSEDEFDQEVEYSTCTK